MHPFIEDIGLASIEPLVAGILEFTQGVTKVSQTTAPLQTKLVLTAFIISFTGLSVHTQSFMFAKNLNIPYLKYFIMRLLHGCTSALIVLLTWKTVLREDIDVFLPLDSTPSTVDSSLIPLISFFNSVSSFKLSPLLAEVLVTIPKQSCIRYHTSYKNERIKKKR